MWMMGCAWRRRRRRRDSHLVSAGRFSIEARARLAAVQADKARLVAQVTALEQELAVARKAASAVAPAAAPGANGDAPGSAAAAAELDKARKELEFQQSVIADLHTKMTKLGNDVAHYKDLYERAAAGLLGTSWCAPPPAQAARELTHALRHCRALTSTGADEPETPTTTKAAGSERPYCVLCEAFGHNSEDCPMAISDPDQSAPRRRRASRSVLRGGVMLTAPGRATSAILKRAVPQPRSGAAPVERPYCEYCEMFGHTSAECDRQDEVRSRGRRSEQESQSHVCRLTLIAEDAGAVEELQTF